MIPDECGCYYDDEDYTPPKPSLWSRFKAKVRSTFQGPPGYPGPQGPAGFDGSFTFIAQSPFWEIEGDTHRLDLGNGFGLVFERKEV